jgi:hypothetical protein
VPKDDALPFVVEESFERCVDLIQIAHGGTKNVRIVSGCAFRAAFLPGFPQGSAS